VAKKVAKRAVSEAKGRAYEGLYQKLSTKEGEREIYKMARFCERKTRDLNQLKCIKDEMDQLLVKGEDIKHRWRGYFDNLYNGGMRWISSWTTPLMTQIDALCVGFMKLRLEKL
jgi:hypothetical protein